MMKLPFKLWNALPHLLLGAPSIKAFSYNSAEVSQNLLLLTRRHAQSGILSLSVALSLLCELLIFMWCQKGITSSKDLIDLGAAVQLVPEEQRDQHCHVCESKLEGLLSFQERLS